MGAHLPLHGNTPAEEDACNTPRIGQLHPHLPITQKNAITSLQKAKQALQDVEAALPALGPVVGRVALRQAQRRIQALEAALRPKRLYARDNNVWVATLCAETGLRLAPVPQHAPPLAILALFPHVEPVWVGPADVPSAEHMSSAE